MEKKMANEMETGTIIQGIQRDIYQHYEVYRNILGDEGPNSMGGRCVVGLTWAFLKRRGDLSNRSVVGNGR